MTQPQVNIIGAGSIGHLWAGYLSQNGIRVTLFHKLSASLPTQKVKLKNENSSFIFEANYKNWDNWTTPNFIIICVKANDLKEVCLELAKLSQPISPIVLMMNGMGLIEIITEYLPNVEVYQASVTHGAIIEKSLETKLPSTIHHTGQGKTSIGRLRFQQKKITTGTSIESIVYLLDQALPLTELSNNHDEMLWNKLLINSVINPLTAIYCAKNGDLLTNPQIRSHAIKLTQELQPIIDRHLADKNWENLWNIIEIVISQTQNNLSSMRQDIINHKPTEIDFISGYLVKCAKGLKISLPEHEHLIQQVKELENEYLNSVTNAPS